MFYNAFQIPFLYYTFEHLLYNYNFANNYKKQFKDNVLIEGFVFYSLSSFILFRSISENKFLKIDKSNSKSNN